MKMFDTITAIATPVGVGGIAIIRLSGEESVKCAEKIIFPKNKKQLSELESHKLTLSDIRRVSDGAVIDEALAVVMKGPHSYTGEDVVEVNCHGGYLVAESVLEELLLAGARLAEPGEFTRRALMNGKTDLLKAEATIDLIHSTSALGRDNAARTLTGVLSEKVEAIRTEAVEFAANISAVADYPDEIDEIPEDILSVKVDSISQKIEELLSGFGKGKIMRDGIKTVIAGRPNVGKSSLLNAISRTDRAIVTDIPGTTRDTVEEYVTVNGIALRLIDTAGIRESENSVERIGIEKAKENIEKSELCLFVIDASEGISDEDLKIFEYTKGKTVIVILNKTDKSMSQPIEDFAKQLKLDPKEIVATATPLDEEPSGIDELEQKICGKFLAGGISKDDVFISNDRQKDALIKAKQIAEGMKQCIKNQMPTDVLYVDLEELIAALGEVTGVTVQDEIIEEVFARFCVGK
ncbi:MAG: tRNA uridine-5-carboxymethylaminomethyl(34) synthesis GTPase MnmE [Ruminococcaceae bacterium]|nr:tRNA uridine-5-carboxymethylaminomethyl(34) synthesis GTPase MnmE [Oscillospiraceae bacterium]